MRQEVIDAFLNFEYVFVLNGNNIRAERIYAIKRKMYEGGDYYLSIDVGREDELNDKDIILSKEEALLIVRDRIEKEISEL